MEYYNHKEIEKKWQKKWQEENLYKIEDETSNKKNFYALVEFPYPSGNLHIGHWYAFAVPDIFVRTKRMQGYNVMFPIGFDAFGLPAENAAIKHGVQPKKWTYENIAYMEKQLESMGNSFDWSRKVITADPEYYRWTQWLFLKFYEKGLAYKKKAAVNWCPSCNTVLANEQAVGGKCERCGSEVVQKDLEQWFFKITDYAERLLTDLEDLKWPNAIKEAQKNWIGRSEGTEVDFAVASSNNPASRENIKVFTTRVDTLFGVTYLVVAPEYEKIEKWHKENLIENWDEVEKYIKEAKSKTEIDRTNEKKEKTGVEIKGIKVINPATNEEVPVFVADYVLGNYGTGAVMAVPAHDERDFEFAKKYNLPIKEVIVPRLIDNRNPHREGKELIFRNAIIAVVKNPKTEKYLCLKWKKHPWVTFVMGGIEDGEDAITAATREIQEETGYKNIKFVKDLGSAQSEFFAAHKDVNRVAHTRNLLFELIDESFKQISDEESAIHEIEWRTFDEINKDDMTHSEMPLILNGLKYGYKPFTEEGILINSNEFTREDSNTARAKITEKFGNKVIRYKLRDWLLSRQRYWGCPIPVVYDPEGNIHPIPEKYLPWLLPEDIKDFAPKGESPIATSDELKERVEKIFGEGFTPEFDTMDTFVDSSWYFNRYADPKNTEKPFDKEKLKQWMPVNRYSGGAEHTNMHLLYSRFFHKALFDMGLVNEPEPFVERMNRGLILGPDGQKMSKSKGNVIDPDKEVEKVGSDTVKMYLAFIGPYNETGQYPWDLGGVAGIRRFLEKVWKLGTKINNPPNPIYTKEEEKLSNFQTFKLETSLHKTIKKVTEDIEDYKFNTAISALMILLNELANTQTDANGTNKIPKESFETFLKLLAPFAPHLTEEIWSSLGYTKSIHLEEWPKFDESKIVDEKVTIVVQINGKVRAQFEVENGAKENEIKSKALSMEETKKWIEGKEIKKTIFVPNKLLNFVV